MCLPCYLPVAPSADPDDGRYQGQEASIEANGHNSLPWSIVLWSQGAPSRRLCDCGSYATAERAFRGYGLKAVR